MGELAKENSQMQTYISYLSVIGVCTPMIGLLGTVTGMIKAFAKLGSSGIGDPSGLSAAIGEVLVATASGLIIAIPAFGAFYFLRNRATDSLHHIQDIVNSLFRKMPYESLAGVHLGDDELFAATPNWLAADAQAATEIRRSNRPNEDRTAMAGGGGGSESGEPEFQVAPMIDVLLTILVFFMTITSAQVLKVDKTIQLPIAKDAQKKDNTRAEAILNVRWKLPPKKRTSFSTIALITNATEMVGPLKTARITGEKKVTAGANPTFRAVIRGDRDVPAIFVSQAMNACAEAGITDISFSAVNKE